MQRSCIPSFYPVSTTGSPQTALFGKHAGYLLAFLLLLFRPAAHAQTPLYTGVPVSDVGVGNNIGEANTSRNLSIDASGNIYVVFTGSQGIRVAKSTNRGQSFQPSVQVTPDDSEPEIEVADNGHIYVVWTNSFGNIMLSKSTNNGASFSTPTIVGIGGTGAPHMAVKGNKVYVVRRDGGTLYYNRNFGVGAFGTTPLPSTYVYGDVRIQEDGVVFVPTDNPFLRLFRSDDSGATLNPITLNPPGNVYFSSYTLSGGGLGNFIFTGGGGIAPSDVIGYSYDLSNGTTNQLTFGTNPTPQGRTLFADDYGDLIDGYRSSTGDLYFNISYNQGLVFQSPILVANGQSHNLGVNHVLEDVVVAYESAGQVYLAVYPDLIRRINISGTIPTALCPGNRFNIPYTLVGVFNMNNVITAQLSDGAGSFASPVNIGSVISNISGTINVTIPAGTPFGTGYRIRLMSNNPLLYSKNNGADITIGAVTPSVSLSRAPDTVCPNIPVTFTATPVNGGAAPLYQFKKNGTNVGPNSTNNVYIDAGLLTSDVITVVMTTGNSCGASTATSNGASVFVRPGVVPAVSLTSSPSGSICSGVPVTFTATPVNGGSAPLYQFKKNGINVGSNTTVNTYTDATLTGTDVITVVMTANNACQSSPTATSNSISLVVNPVVTPTVSITANPGDSVCRGASVTFTAAPLNGGSTPAYQWRKNGVNVGGNTVSYTDAGLATGDVISVRLTSNMACRTTDTVNSNTIRMWVATASAPPAQPSLIAGATRICSGSSQAYSVTAVPTATSYTWTLPASWSGSSATNAINTTVGNPGIGVITVRANNDCGSSLPQTLADTVITVPAQPGPVTGSNSACANTAQTYNIAAVPDAVSYTWTVPAGWGTPVYVTTTMNTTAASVFGSGNITVTATNACGTSPASVLPVTAVTIVPAQPTPISGSINVCGGTAQPYTVGAVTQATSYVWTLPMNGWTTTGATGNTAITTTPNLAAIAGTNGGTLEVYASNGCGTSASRSLAINVTNTPGRPGTVSGPDSLCAGAAATYSIGYVNEATSYTWTTPATGSWAGTSTNQLLNVVAGTTPGAATITVAGTNVCGTGPVATKTVWITTPVTPTVTLAASNTTMCSGQPITFTATPANGGTLPLYQWRVNGMNTGTPTTNPVFTSTGLNNGDVVSVVLNSNAVCATVQYVLSSNAIPVQITPTVTPGVNINASRASNTLCEGTPVTFTATPLTGAGSSPAYQWRKNNTNVGTNSVTYTDATLTSSDSIYVIMTSSAACVTSATGQSNKIGMQVSPVVTPVATITANPGTVVGAGTLVTFTAQAVNGGMNPGWQWLKNGRAIAGAINDTYTTSSLRDGDVISVVLTPDMVCVSGTSIRSNSLTMQISTRVGGAGNLAGDIRLFPNPNNGRFTISVTGGTVGRQLKIEVIGLLGQVISHTAVTPDRKDWSVDLELNNAAAGAYLLRLSDAQDGRTMTVKKFEVIR